MFPSKDDAKYYFRAHLLASIWQTCYVRSIRQIGDSRSHTDFAPFGWRLQPFVICSLACSEKTLKWCFTSSDDFGGSRSGHPRQTPWEQHYKNAKLPLGFLAFTLNKASASVEGAYIIVSTTRDHVYVYVVSCCPWYLSNNHFYDVMHII